MICGYLLLSLTDANPLPSSRKAAGYEGHLVPRAHLQQGGHRLTVSRAVEGPPGAPQLGGPLEAPARSHKHKALTLLLVLTLLHLGG